MFEGCWSRDPSAATGVAGSGGHGQGSYTPRARGDWQHPLLTVPMPESSEAVDTAHVTNSAMDGHASALDPSAVEVAQQQHNFNIMDLVYDIAVEAAASGEAISHCRIGDILEAISRRATEVWARLGVLGVSEEGGITWININGNRAPVVWESSDDEDGKAVTDAG